MCYGPRHIPRCGVMPFLAHFCISPSSCHMSAFGRYTCNLYLFKLKNNNQAICWEWCYPHNFMHCPSSRGLPANGARVHFLKQTWRNRNDFHHRILAARRRGAKGQGMGGTVHRETTSSYSQWFNREHQGIFPEWPDTSGFSVVETQD